MKKYEEALSDEGVYLLRQMIGRRVLSINSKYISFWMAGKHFNHYECGSIVMTLDGLIRPGYEFDYVAIHSKQVETEELWSDYSILSLHKQPTPEPIPYVDMENGRIAITPPFSMIHVGSKIKRIIVHTVDEVITEVENIHKKDNELITEHLIYDHALTLDFEDGNKLGLVSLVETRSGFKLSWDEVEIKKMLENTYERLVFN